MLLYSVWLTKIDLMINFASLGSSWSPRNERSSWNTGELILSSLELHIHFSDQVTVMWLTQFHIPGSVEITRLAHIRCTCSCDWKHNVHVAIYFYMMWYSRNNTTTPQWGEGEYITNFCPKTMTNITIFFLSMITVLFGIHIQMIPLYVDKHFF